MGSLQLDLEIGPAVAVNVATDNRLVLGSSRQIDDREMELAGRVMKCLAADELEFLVAAAGLCVDRRKVDRIGAGEIRDDIPLGAPLRMRQRREVEIVTDRPAGQKILARPSVNIIDIGTAIDAVTPRVPEEKILAALAGDRGDAGRDHINGGAD